MVSTCALLPVMHALPERLDRIDASDRRIDLMSYSMATLWIHRCRAGGSEPLAGRIGQQIRR